MSVPDLLRLAAIDDEDLAVVSTFAQDAVLKVGDIVYLPSRSRFALAMNRFVWEMADGRRRSYERRRTALVFDRVRAAQTYGIDRAAPETVLELLAIRFAPSNEPPDGTIELTFAGGAGIRLDVECIETRLADLGAAWATGSRPWHAIGDDEPAAPSKAGR